MPSQPGIQPRDMGLLVLALLGQREMYGYELLGELRRQTDAVVDLPEGTIYPALRRLERQGLVAGRWVVVENAPRRRYYALTRDGERALSSGRRSWRRFVSATETILGP
jgi:PadR family transcriptional regulator, regulatory protein PadR